MKRYTVSTTDGDSWSVMANGCRLALLEVISDLGLRLGDGYMQSPDKETVAVKVNATWYISECLEHK